MPDSTRAVICSGELVAGPRVQTILARRDMGETLVDLLTVVVHRPARFRDGTAPLQGPAASVRVAGGSGVLPQRSETAVGVIGRGSMEAPVSQVSRAPAAARPSAIANTMS